MSSYIHDALTNLLFITIIVLQISLLLLSKAVLGYLWWFSTSNGLDAWEWNVPLIFLFLFLHSSNPISQIQPPKRRIITHFILKTLRISLTLNADFQAKKWEHSYKCTTIVRSWGKSNHKISNINQMLRINQTKQHKSTNWCTIFSSYNYRFS